MDKDIVLWIMGGLIIIIAWFASRKIAELEKADVEHIKEIRDLQKDNADLRLHISEQQFVKRSELDEKFDKIDEKLEKIFDKLNNKADK